MNPAVQTHDFISVIEPKRGWVGVDFQELWRFRELLYFLTWRDVKVRYKQTLLGGAWAILQPLLTMVVFSVFFGGLAKVSSDGLPYPLFSFAALVPWTFFANGVMQSSNSLVASSNLLTKVYFPRLMIPAAGVLSGLVDFVLSLVILMIMIAGYGIRPGVNVLWLPLFALLAITTALGIGLALAAINVKYRDVRYAVPFIVQIWMYASPVAYSSSIVPEQWRVVFGLNPMVGVVEGFRWALLGTPAPSEGMIAASLGVAVLFLVGGILYFRRTERTFADMV